MSCPPFVISFLTFHHVFQDGAQTPVSLWRHFHFVDDHHQIGHRLQGRPVVGNYQVQVLIQFKDLFLPVLHMREN